MAVARAAEALRYLGGHYPECLEDLRVLDERETATHEAALLGDREDYPEALRGYMKASKDAALKVRRGQQECERRADVRLRSALCYANATPPL